MGRHFLLRPAIEVSWSCFGMEGCQDIVLNTPYFFPFQTLNGCIKTLMINTLSNAYKQASLILWLGHFLT